MIRESSLPSILFLLVIVQLSGCAGMDGLRKEKDVNVQRELPLSSGAVNKVDPEVKRVYRESGRTTKDDFVDQSPDEGSLWATNGQTNYYFTKNKVRSPGDIINVTIEPDLYKGIAAEIKQTLSKKEKEIEVENAREFYRDKFVPVLAAIDAKAAQASNAGSADAKAKDAAPEPEPLTPASKTDKQVVERQAPLLPTPRSHDDAERTLSRVSLKDVDLYPALDFKAGDKMLGEIVERYPNGNYKVRAVRRIPYSRGNQRTVTLVGVVKASDIDDETDTLSSGKLYEYRTEIAR